MAKPFFSIVIPTLNEEKYLPRVLKDVARQIDKDYEVIVVDGKSEDRTVVKAREYEKKLTRMKVIEGQKRNVSWQRNAGAKAAEGRWLIFLDADVSVPLNFLSEIHNFVQVQKQCRFLTTWMKPDSPKKSDRLLANLANVMMEIANGADKPAVGGFNMIVERKTFLRVGGFNENWVPGMSEDYELAKRLVKYGADLNILKSPKIVMSFRRFRREGTLNLLRKYALAITVFLLEGPMAREVNEYPMGGRSGTKRGKADKGWKEYGRKIKQALLTEWNQFI